MTSEGDAGFYIVAAVHEGEQMLFLVEPGTPGMEITRTPRFLHDPYLDHHPEIVFTNCRVPDANRVPGGDAGSREWILVERLFIAARCCGAAERLLDEATAWAQEREAFGGPIIENQGVSFPLADSLTELHAARLLTYHAAHAFDTLADRKVVHGKVAMAKLYASEMAGRVADRSVQILGGRGYMHENAAARFYRELRVDRIWEGTSEIQRLIIATGPREARRGAVPRLGDRNVIGRGSGATPVVVPALATGSSASPCQCERATRPAPEEVPSSTCQTIRMSLRATYVHGATPREGAATQPSTGARFQREPGRSLDARNSTTVERRCRRGARARLDARRRSCGGYRPSRYAAPRGSTARTGSR